MCIFRPLPGPEKVEIICCVRGGLLGITGVLAQQGRTITQA